MDSMFTTAKIIDLLLMFVNILFCIFLLGFMVSNPHVATTAPSLSSPPDGVFAFA
jgi:hypothetical protein